MVRAPCCEKLGLKKGPWTPEEDQTLIDYIHRHGHGNWRQLPKQAGLLRCGKSCRLRWVNYLKPDIKRGNFTKEEEDIIIMLHQTLGNKWSVIAARLPGRTDNEIKNIWHTHLKKKIKQNQASSGTKQCCAKLESQHFESQPMSSPQHSSNTDTSVVTGENRDFPQADENLWSEALPMENFSLSSEDFTATGIESADPRLQFPFSPLSNAYESMDFWYNLIMETGEFPEIPDF
ncbi:hypothetical protein GIB67_032405 [Kingdonia uniflora]|uniref:Uncharacterized protein n=1 Tax=Kingdonia uniflora TaxID=39325 RepID=A0A7J7MIS2_9MAGN|nr:hypothetical protein GIB67_032405 [Kingdonia uniflora]